MSFERFFIIFADSFLFSFRSLGEKVGYSLGDAAANLVFQMMMIFQLKFYTDVFGLDGAVAGSILMIGSLSAIVVDPLVGILSDHTKTRWGKFRPWVLWTAIPFCIFYLLAGYPFLYFLFTCFL